MAKKQPFFFIVTSADSTASHFLAY